MEASDISSAPPSWRAKVPIEGKNHGKEYNLIATEEENELQVNLCDGNCTLIGKYHREHGSGNETANSIAFVPQTQRFSLIREGLRSRHSKTTARVVIDKTASELRISTPWGQEFGDININLDIAAIPLEKKRGNNYFLSKALEKLDKNRHTVQEQRSKRKLLELEIGDLIEAKHRLDTILNRRNDRMRVFADALNGYKGNCRENHRKEKNIVQNSR